MRCKVGPLVQNLRFFESYKESNKGMKNLVKKIVVMLLCVTMVIGVLPPLSAGADTSTENPLIETENKEPEQDNQTVTVWEERTLAGVTSEEVFPAEKMIVAEVTAFERRNPMQGTMVGVMLTDITSGELIASKNSTMLVSPSELSEWMLLLYVLRNVNLKKEITITKEMLADAKKAEYPVLIGLQENDTASVETLLKMFMMTRADDVRTALVSAMGGTEKKAVSQLNQLANRLQLKDTKIVATDGAYVSGQHTNAYDLYVIFRELLTHELFAENYDRTYMSVRWTLENGRKKSMQIKNAEHAYSNLYGAPDVPEGYDFLTRMSGGCAKSGLSQVLLAEGPDGHIYMGVLTGIPFEKDIALEMNRLLQVLEGGTYFDKEQELPLGDDEVRYDYLLGTEVVYYTVDNKAPGYTNNKEAERYMMEITVPVWHLDDATGVRTASSMQLKINRKLVNSVKKIFQEIFELPCQFPIKTLLGYGYRQSGGVGLSNCTLMSIHSYGAAIDINPGDYDNDYYLGAGNDLRDKSNPYCIPEEVIEIFEKNGWFWGGDFSICVDAMHFQYLGLDFLTYQDNSPFMIVDLSAGLEVGSHIENLQLRLTELGYRVNKNGIYTEQTREAVRKFQTREGLPADGVVDYKTWETIINLTHYMPYAF